MQVDISWALVALLAGLFIGFGVSAWVWYRWVHPKPPKLPKVIEVPGPTTVVTQQPAVADPGPLTKPQPAVTA